MGRSFAYASDQTPPWPLEGVDCQMSNGPRLIAESVGAFFFLGGAVV